MAEKLEDYNFSRGRPRGSKLDKYLDGGIYRLKLGRDVAERMESARSAFFARARSKGCKVHTASEGNYIVVQAYDFQQAQPSQDDVAADPAF